MIFYYFEVMKLQLVVFLLSIFIVPASDAQHSVYTELKSLADVSLLPVYSDADYTAQISSYDTTGGNDDGFSGRYSFIKRNQDSTLVLFDQHGPGIINRIWTPTPSDDTLDFYIDSEDKIRFSISYRDLFSGKVFPFILPLCGNQLGGFYSYIPIPFAKSCKIVLRAKKTQFHQIQYKMFLPGTEVESFSPSFTDKEKKTLEMIHTKWSASERSITSFYTSPYQKIEKKLKLSPGTGSIITKLTQPGRILGIEISPSTAFESISKDIDLKVTWDDEKIPAIYCPVADYFGFAFGQGRMQSLLLGIDGAVCYSYFPMPFDKSASIELIHRNSNAEKKLPVEINISIYYSLQKRVPEREGKFYTYWNRSKSESGRPHLFLDHQGKGHYVGTLLQAQGLLAGMTYFFEGDDSTVLDGKLRLHGTGSEDYFNGGWYAMMDRWDQAMSLPLHGALDYSLLFCRTGGYRFYLSDKLIFNKKIHHSIEHGPVGNNFPVDYTSLAMYYSDHGTGKQIIPANELSKVYFPDTLVIYPQLIESTNFGNISIDTYWKYGTGGESYRYSTDKDSWLKISLKEVPAGLYDVVFDIQKENTGADFSVWQRQSPISPWYSAYSEYEHRNQNLHIGLLHLGTDNKSITIRMKTEGIMKSLLLHRIKLIRKNE